ncbi:MAG: hypothetical protein ABMB14_18305, partial [Myxococcota bacterium]
HDALHHLAAWVHLGQVGVGLDAARLRATGASPPAATRRGEDVVMVPVGVELVHGRPVIHGLDAADGAPVTVEDEWLGVDADDPLARPVPSRLFQATIDPRAVLTSTLVVRDHPVARVAGRRVIRPAFHTAAVRGDPVGDVPIPRTERAGRGLVRVFARAVRAPSGWQLIVPGIDPVEVDQPLIQLELEKRSAVGGIATFELIALVTRHRLTVLRIDGGFPAVDPRATRWDPATVRSRLDGEPLQWLDAAFGGPTPPIDGDPALDPDAVRRAVAAGDVLPSARELWRLGRAVAPTAAAPIRALGLPEPRLWLAAVAPLAGWLRSDRPVDDAVVDALILIVGADLTAIVFHPPAGSSSPPPPRAPDR